MVTLQEVDDEDLNPHVFLCICEICSEIIKKPKKNLKYQILSKLLDGLIERKNGNGISVPIM